MVSRIRAGRLRAAVAELGYHCANVADDDAAVRWQKVPGVPRGVSPAAVKVRVIAPEVQRRRERFRECFLLGRR